MSELKITLSRSVNSVKEDQRATVRALGLKKIGSSVVRQDVPQVRGMIKKVCHLIKVEEI
ncbi:MAG: 50S ribosomal protein L30 [Clostridiales bacterium]|nr:50S ribosomal protein L30 [Clostridiales bacterium]